MTNLRKTLLGAVAGLATLTSASTASAEDIVDIAVGAGTFNSLILAAAAAGLADDLKGEGPFTVFAPNDDAFAALPEGTVENLLKPENRDQLISILLYHVDDRDLKSSDIGAKSIYIKPINTDFRFCASWGGDGTLTVTDSTGTAANVIAADIVADNGRIHVIDKVMIPGKVRC